MSFPIPSDIFQNDTKMLKEQQQEMQKRHKRSNVEKSSRDILSWACKLWDKVLTEDITLLEGTEEF